MPLKSLTQEELKAHLVNLTAEITKFNSDHQSHLQALQQQQNNLTQESSKKKTCSYVTQGRRASCDLQQYLQGGIKALEEFYEPRLVSLLKRREATTKGLRKAKEQCQELRSKLGPLKDEEQMLRLQKTCLEERLRLMESQRKENVEQYRVRTRVNFIQTNVILDFFTLKVWSSVFRRQLTTSRKPAES